MQINPSSLTALLGEELFSMDAIVMKRKGKIKRQHFLIKPSRSSCTERDKKRGKAGVGLGDEKKGEIAMTRLGSRLLASLSHLLVRVGFALTYLAGLILKQLTWTIQWWRKELFGLARISMMLYSDAVESRAYREIESV